MTPEKWSGAPEEVNRSNHTRKETEAFVHRLIQRDGSMLEKPVDFEPTSEQIQSALQSTINLKSPSNAFQLLKRLTDLSEADKQALVNVILAAKNAEWAENALHWVEGLTDDQKSTLRARAQKGLLR